MLRVATVLTVASLLLMGVSLAVGLSVAESSDTAPVTVDKRVYGYGQIRYGGKGPEAWRWEKILVTRRAQAAERRLNEARGTIRQLQAVVGQTFIPSYWVAIASCESGVDWRYNGRSGFDGALQFHPGTWSAYRLRSYPAFAYLASPFQQLVVGELVLSRQGWKAWPACSRKLGLR